MVSGAEPYLVGFLWVLVMGCDGPDWRVGPLWVPRQATSILQDSIKVRRCDTGARG